MIWKKKQDNEIIQCSACEWSPDGEIHWACSCGHMWNTFKTKGKCPKCKIQWEDTRCPACHNIEPHLDWYKTKEEIEQIEKSASPEMRLKKKRLESRLIEYGIKNYRVKHLPYLDVSNEQFQSPYDAGCRMIILFAIGYSVHNLDKRNDLIEWLKDEKIWDKVSFLEKEYLIDPEPDEEQLMDLSWRIESALTLGWCLNKVNHLPRLDNNNYQDVLDEFQSNIPEIGEPLLLFLSQLGFRNSDEIYEENLLNELATTYFRDLMFSGEKDKTKINRYSSFERHQVLNWLRMFGGNDEWDETDTST